MQILTIDDRPELEDIGGYFQTKQETVLITNKKTLLYDTARKVKKTTRKGEWVIFINLFLSCKDGGLQWQQNQAGLALLKFLRMMEVNHHVVLVTPFSFEYLIKQDVANHIIACKGVSLTEPKYSAMYDFSEFEGADDVKARRNRQSANTENSFDFTNQFAKYLHELMINLGWIQEQKGKAEQKRRVSLQELAEKAFEKEALTPYIQSGFELPEDERHNWANWWGIVQLCDVHRSAFPNELNFGNSKSYPGKIDDSLKSLKNYQLRKIYHTEDSFHRALGTVLRTQLKEDLNVWIKEIEEIERKKLQLSSRVKETAKAVREGTEHRETLTDQQNELRELENELKSYQEEKENIEEKLIQLSRVIESEENLSSEYINEIRFKGREAKPKILYIDDQAHEGWSDIFQIMLYGERNQSRDIFQPISKINDDIHSFYSNTIKPAIQEGIRPDLILLDLRLLNEGGTLKNILDISGTKLLKYIRKDFPGQPIMMTTASNKAWSVRELSKLGIDCYWTKEGVDVSQSLPEESRKKYSTKNYLSFFKYVDALTGDNYQLLKKLEKLIKKISKNKNWWENPNWIHSLEEAAPELQPSQVKTNPKIVIENLTNILFLLRYYFHLIHFRQGDKQINNSWFYSSLIIQHLGKIIEAIHSFEHLINEDFTPRQDNVLKVRKDDLSVGIYRIRNRASHFNNAQHLKIENIHKMVNLIYRYLLNTPNCVIKR